MPRRPRKWLPNGTGKRIDHRTGRRLPGYYVCWNEYSTAGRQCRRSRHFHKQCDARKWCRRQNAATDLEAIGEVLPIPITEATEHFIGSLGRRSPATIREYACSIDLLTTYTGDVDVHTITGATLDSYLATLTCAESTAAKHVRQLRAFFNWCIKRNHITTNPATAITAPPRSNAVRRKPRITDAQFVALLGAIDTADRRLAVQIAATTGLDRNVIARLTPADVDLGNKQFITTRIKTRTLVDPFIHDALLHAVAERVQSRDSSQPLVDGLTVRRGSDNAWFRQAAAAAGVPGFRFVDLRSYAANYLKRAIGDFAASKVLGHSSLDVTSRHYHSIDPQAQAQVSSLPLPGSPTDRAAPKTG